MATEYGFVYILGNQSMPGIYKIGFTLGHPKARMEQLSGATACPTPFDMLACFGVADPRQVEGLIHEQYAACRVNSSREFFQMDPDQLQDIVGYWSDPYDDLVNSNYLEAIARDQRRVDDYNWKINHFQSQCADPVHWPERGGFR